MFWIMEDGEVIAGPFDTVEAANRHCDATGIYGDSIVGPGERPRGLSELLGLDDD